MAADAAKIVARLTLVVDYEEVPDTDEIESLVESARGLGIVVQAELTMLKTTKKDFK